MNANLPVPGTRPGPYVARLRTRPDALVLGDAAGAGRWTIRVEMPDVWDTVRIEAPPTEPVVAVKVAALGALFPSADVHADFVVKLRGIEVRDEQASLEAAGAVDGSILLVTHRRRRPVR